MNISECRLRKERKDEKREIEVLAPAGSMECLRAAVLNGADAVYLGGEMFGARAYAGNFKKKNFVKRLTMLIFLERRFFLRSTRW